MPGEWTSEDIAERFEEAIRTLKRLPPVKVQGYFNLWPAIKYTERELWDMEKQPMRLGPPAANAIDRLEQTLRWIVWLEEEERKLVWMRAARMPWKPICHRFGVDRKTAWRHWTKALGKISDRLNKAGVPVPHLPAELR